MDRVSVESMAGIGTPSFMGVATTTISQLSLIWLLIYDESRIIRLFLLKNRPLSMNSAALQVPYPEAGHRLCSHGTRAPGRWRDTNPVTT
jgi:hypothetical protein